jgi:hypothetical protein
MDKKDQRTYDEMVTGIMATLDANYMSLVRHPYTRGARADEAAAGQVSELLNRSIPITENEKIVAATFRWIASRQRGAFIKLMFEGHFACASLVVDDGMVAIGLNSEKTFSVTSTAEGFRIGDPRPARSEKDGSGNRKKGGGGRGRRDDSRADGGRGRRDDSSRGRRDDSSRGRRDASNADGRGCRDENRKRRDDQRPAPAAHRAPVLDEAACRDLLDELDREAVGGSPAAPAPAIVAPAPTVADPVLGPVSYLVAASGESKSSEPAAPATKVTPVAAAPTTTVPPVAAAPATKVAPVAAAPATKVAPVAAAPATKVAPVAAAPTTTSTASTTATAEPANTNVMPSSTRTDSVVATDVVTKARWGDMDEDDDLAPPAAHKIDGSGAI